MRTVRLIIYDGPEAWMEQQRGRDLQTPYEIAHFSGHASILSVELDPKTIMLTEAPDEIDEMRLGISSQIIKHIKMKRDQ